MKTDYDVAIIGGSFSGACSAIMLKREMPDCRVLVVERSKEFDRKVGESTSEVAGCFLTKVMGLHGYLSRNHIVKHGLRMWFNPDGEEAAGIGDCSEVGAKFQVRLPTYQLDRSHLDQYLLDQAEQAGCEVLRPAVVKSIELGGAGKNVIEIDDGSEGRRTVSAGWVIDASGKAALLARQRKTLQKLEEHPINSMWARFSGAGDFDGYDLKDKFPCYGMSAPPVSRGAATNHLMGYGWWCWIIPLRGGETSIGITWDPRLFTPPSEGSIPERIKAHLMTQTVGRELFEQIEPLENDARVYSHLPYLSDEVAGDGWAAVGDAAGFMDPLYSQGLDFCGHTVYAVYEIVLEHLRGVNAPEKVEIYKRRFQTSYRRWFEALYKDKYRYLGDAELMYAAFLMDIGAYFVGPVRLVYDAPEKEYPLLPYHGFIGALFARFMRFYNKRLAKIAEKRRAAGVYGKSNYRRRLLVGRGFSPGFGSFLLMMRGVGVWVKCEIKALFLRAKKRQAAEVQQEALSKSKLSSSES